MTGFELAQNYGVHFDKSGQTYQLFADMPPGNGVFDSADKTMTAIQKIDTSKRGIIILDAINVTYKFAKSVCTDNLNNTLCTKSVSTIDIAAATQTVSLVFHGGSDFPALPTNPLAGDAVIIQGIQFTVKNTDTQKTATVSIAPLSGRIDVQY